MAKLCAASGAKVIPPDEDGGGRVSTLRGRFPIGLLSVFLDTAPTLSGSQGWGLLCQQWGGCRSCQDGLSGWESLWGRETKH